MIDEAKLLQELENFTISVSGSANAMALMIIEEYRKRFVQMVKNQEKVGEWTSCSEYKPPDGVICELSCRYLTEDYVDVGYCKDGKPEKSYLIDNEIFRKSEVLAWRKMPETYKDGDLSAK